MAKYCMVPAGAASKGTIETVIALQVLYGKVLHGPCRACVAKVL